MIGILIFPDFQLLDAAGPISAFEIGGRYAGKPLSIRVLALNAGPVRSSSGVEMMAQDFKSARAITTLVVAGGEGVASAARCKTTLAFVQRLARRGVRIASVCSGAYVLAEAGLLDGRRATTHWGRAAELARAHPQARVDPDRIFIRDGAVWTSAGITAGIDLALALVAEDLGEGVAKRAAQQLVVYYRRPGGQSQFSALLETDRPNGRFASLLGWARERLHERLSVERLAEHMAMSPRHFARAFAAETGITPAKAIERLRLEAARDIVESSAEPIEGVAVRTGFADPERMRRAFIRAFGQPPQGLRRIAKIGLRAGPNVV